MQDQVLGKIIDAKIDHRKGCIITIISDISVQQGDIAKFVFPNPDGSEGTQYFKVEEVSIIESKLKVSMKETGYCARALSRRQNFDIRSIIGIDVIHINDPTVLAKVHEMSCWC